MITCPNISKKVESLGKNVLLVFNFYSRLAHQVDHSDIECPIDRVCSKLGLSRAVVCKCNQILKKEGLIRTVKEVNYNMSNNSEP